MRIRPLAALSVAALSAVLLAGCSGIRRPQRDARPRPPAADLCCVGRALGRGIRSRHRRSAKPGKPATVDIHRAARCHRAAEHRRRRRAPATRSSPATSSARSRSRPSTPQRASRSAARLRRQTILPQQISPDSGARRSSSAARRRARASSRPSPPPRQAARSGLRRRRARHRTPNAAWGDPQPPVAGMPTVKLADDGSPTVTLPKGDMPTDVHEGHAQEGRRPGGRRRRHRARAVPRRRRGTPARCSTRPGASSPSRFTVGSGVVQGFTRCRDRRDRRLAGHRRASAVGRATARARSTTTDLTGQTLVFVVDILGVQPAAPAQ